MQILVGQVFAFVESQFTAVFGLGVAILMLVTLRYMIRSERDLEQQPRAPEAPSAAEPPPARAAAHT